MRLKQLKGTGTALITPFKNGKVDFDALESIIEYNINGGVEYLVSLGSTGEALTIPQKDCQAILKFTLKVANGRVPVIAGCFGGGWTAALQERFSIYDIEGCAAVLSSNPNYNKPSQEGIFQHYMKLAETSPLPIIIYNVPGRAASNISAETTVRLANASDKFVAIKEASADLVQIQKILKHRPEGFMVLSGDDPTALATAACGGDGVISVISNAFPREFSDMMRAALSGDLATAMSLNNELLDLHQWLYKDGNPSGIKAVMHLLGYCENELYLPLVPVTEHTMGKLKEEVGKIARFTTMAA